jgi:hypothetical protein
MTGALNLKVEFARQNLPNLDTEDEIDIGCAGE